MGACSAGIFGIAGLRLSDGEKRFFKKLNPLGFILFARNCESPAQVKALTASLRTLLKRDDILILIDQEGGRVARLKPPHWRLAPPAGIFADFARDHSLTEAKKAVYMNARMIARELQGLGINVDCAPLADIPVKGAHDIIGDRAYGDEPKQVSALAGAMGQGLLDGGVLPVLKHIPGHGRARADSHKELPVVSESLALLRKTDFKPFKALNDLPLGMTAHILYTAIDAKLPATLSPKVIAFIRKEIGFKGLLMSDDLSMKALKGSFAERTRRTLDAGCDLVLHCNGKMSEMRQIATALPPLSPAARKRFSRALALLAPSTRFDYAAASRSLKKAVGAP